MVALDLVSVDTKNPESFTLKQNLPGSQKSANYPYEGFETFYGLNRKAYMAATGASQPRAFNFFRYALILRSRLN